MNISVILAHPNQKSFNHAIANTAVEVLVRNGHSVFFHDLYAEQFDPLLPFEEFEKDACIPSELQVYCDEIASSDGIIIVHPDWWGQPPAIMKGWIDRVIRPGIAYEFKEEENGEGLPIGLLQAQAAIVFNTANTPEEREIKVFGDPLEILWKTCIFDSCGVHVCYRKMFRIIVTSTAEQRRKWLEEVRSVVQKYF